MSRYAYMGRTAQGAPVKGTMEAATPEAVAMRLSQGGVIHMVNDRVVRVGDHVDGARIVRITKKGVELWKDGETLFLTLIEKDFFR